MTEAPPGDDAAGELLKLLGGKWVAAAVSTAASLGLADALDEKAMNAPELAVALSCDENALSRLLRVLAAEEVVAELPDGRYGLTEIGAQLRTDTLGPLAAFVGESFSWAPWAQLSSAIRKGQTAFEVEHGQDLFTYLREHHEASQVYQAGVDAFTRHEARALVEAFDFGTAKNVVDIGGGMGSLLIELLNRWPHLHGVLYDQAHVIEAATPRLQSSGLASRCEAVAGDFFTSVPKGGDIYVVRHVVHNWGDAEAATVLRHCAEALPPGGKVLVIEGILLPGNRKDMTRLLDLEMMVLSGTGRERNKAEFRQLFKKAGLRLTSTRPLANTARIIIGEH